MSEEKLKAKILLIVGEHGPVNFGTVLTHLPRRTSQAQVQALLEILASEGLLKSEGLPVRYELTDQGESLFEGICEGVAS